MALALTNHIQLGYPLESERLSARTGHPPCLIMSTTDPSVHDPKDKLRSLAEDERLHRLGRSEPMPLFHTDKELQAGAPEACRRASALQRIVAHHTPPWCAAKLDRYMARLLSGRRTPSSSCSQGARRSLAVHCRLVDLVVEAAMVAADMDAAAGDPDQPVDEG